MGIKDAIFKKLGIMTFSEASKIRNVLKMAGLGSDDDEEDEGGGRSRGPKELKTYEDYAKAYKRSGWVYSAINRISTSAAQVPLRIYELDNKGTPVEIVEHEAKALLETVNPWMTGFDLWETTFAYLEISAKCFWVLLPNASNPKEIWPVRPDRMKILEDSKKYIKGFEYEVNGSKTTYLPEQVIYLHSFDPLDERSGTSSLEASAAAILLDDYAIISNKRYFMNDGTPGGVIKTPKDGIPLQDPDIRRYERHWDKRFKGVDNKNRTAVLPPGWEYDPINPTLADMQFLELRKNNREEMLATINVPPSLNGILEYANYSNMEAQETFFWKFTMMPRLRKVEAALNSFFFPRWKNKRIYCEFDLSEFLADDEHDRVKTDVLLVRNGLRTINELRRRDNVEDVSWGDTWWTTTNTVSIEAIMSGAAIPANSAVPTEPSKPPTISAGGTQTNKQPAETEEIDNPNEPASKSSIVKADNGLEYTPDEIDHLEKANAKIDQLEVKFVKSVVNAFDKQEQAVLGKLKSQTKKALEDEIDINMIIREGDLAQDMVDASAPLFVEGTTAGAADLIIRHALDLSFDVHDPKVSEFVRNKAMFFVQTVNDTTYEAVRSGLISGIEAGETEKQLADRVKEAFAGRRNNAATIARTEIAEAYNYGAHTQAKAAKQASLLTKKLWLTALNAKVRPWHKDAHRQERDIEESFSVMGEELMFPADRDSGASGKNTINCRCVAKYEP